MPHDNSLNNLARHGWSGSGKDFLDSSPESICGQLESFLPDSSPEQHRAWLESVKLLKDIVAQWGSLEPKVRSSLILEYELPMESRRPDAVIIVGSTIFVIEFKSKSSLSQADLDQADAYGRDLRCYHSVCQENQVISIAVATRSHDVQLQHETVNEVSPGNLANFITSEARLNNADAIQLDKFLSDSAYRPMPSLIKAARELFQTGNIRPIHRARAATEPAVNTIIDVIKQAATNQTRNLILLTGIPGAGKTLVGLQCVHCQFLDDLSAPRDDGKPVAPAVFLSGNGPLVQVLQYELKSAGGGGKAFVRDVKQYVKRYSSRTDQVPPEHVLVFDEAQRAYDAKQVKAKHSTTPGFSAGKSEPEHFVEFAERIPDWCVVIGLIGSGQEIHVGEEGGLIQWRHAIDNSPLPTQWSVHGPPQLSSTFEGSATAFQVHEALNLDTEIRFHHAEVLHVFVESLLKGSSPKTNVTLANELGEQSYHLRITRDLHDAKAYLRERYGEQEEARFGMIASAKDKVLVQFGIPNDFQSTKRVKFGPWYSDAETIENSHSCRLLKEAVTEFGAQGLELESALLCWGTDLIRQDNQWSTQYARGYQKKAHVKDPFQLRINSYRVLLTRGRDGVVIYIPPIPELDETYQYLVDSGFKLFFRPTSPVASPSANR